MMDKKGLLEQRIDELIQKFDKVVKLGLVPIGNIKKEDIEEYKRNLNDRRFIVSFCGQIKSGKSTLLNALIFEDLVLPVGDTPLTAKLTLIKYGRNPKFCAEFYTIDDWESLKKETYEKEDPTDPERTIQASYFEDFLKESVERAITEWGIYEDEVIKEDGYLKEETDLKNLKDYVGADGKYTPFVKQVTIYYPSDFLRYIEIVDTPGTNDPNKLRSKITLDWIKKSDAVVYVVYAGRAFDSIDIEFIDKYLIHIPPNILLFAVNKIDQAESLSEIKEWVEKDVRRNEKLRLRNIMADLDSAVYVCGLGALLDKMDKKGKEIPSELEFYFDKLDEAGYLDNHNLEELSSAIEKKIIKNKEKELFLAAKRKLETIFDLNILRIKNNIESAKEEIKALSLTQKEIEEKLKELEEKNKKIEGMKKELEHVLDKKLKNYFLEIEKKLDEIRERIIKDLGDKIEQEKKFDNLKSNLPWHFKNAFLKKETEIKEAIVKHCEEVTEELKLKLEEAFRELGRLQTAKLYISLVKLMEDVEDRIQRVADSASEETLHSFEEIKRDFWESFWDSVSEDTKNAVIIRVENAIKKSIGKIKNAYKEILSRDIDNGQKEFEKIIEEEIRKIENSYYNAKATLSEKENRKKELTQQIEVLKNKLKEVKNFKREVCL